MKFAFIILHYITVQDTIDCVKSIRDNCDDSYHIYIVDNASPNNSYEILYKEFGLDKDVDIIQSETNVGFAKGNNLGISRAKCDGGYDFLVIMNNDTILLQRNTMSIVEKDFLSTHFAVMGPMVISADGRCDSNPGSCQAMTEDEIDKYINDREKDLFIMKCHLSWLVNVKHQISLFVRSLLGKKTQPVETKKEFMNRAMNVQLHGCFLIFSNVFFEKFIGFEPSTFLYLEENILFYQIRKEGLLSLYDPQLQIFHKEDSSTNAIWNNEQRIRNKTEYYLDSARCFKKIIAQDK